MTTRQTTFYLQKCTGAPRFQQPESQGLEARGSKLANTIQQGERSDSAWRILGLPPASKANSVQEVSTALFKFAKGQKDPSHHTRGYSPHLHHIQIDSKCISRRHAS
jgi:hypothetical protein